MSGAGAGTGKSKGQSRLDSIAAIYKAHGYPGLAPKLSRLSNYQDILKAGKITGTNSQARALIKHIINFLVLGNSSDSKLKYSVTPVKGKAKIKVFTSFNILTKGTYGPMCAASKGQILPGILLLHLVHAHELYLQPASANKIRENATPPKPKLTKEQYGQLKKIKGKLLNIATKISNEANESEGVTTLFDKFNRNKNTRNLLAEYDNLVTKRSPFYDTFSGLKRPKQTGRMGVDRMLKKSRMAAVETPAPPTLSIPGLPGILTPAPPPPPSPNPTAAFASSGAGAGSSSNLPYPPRDDLTTLFAEAEAESFWSKMDEDLEFAGTLATGKFPIELVDGKLVFTFDDSPATENLLVFSDRQINALKHEMNRPDEKDPLFYVKVALVDFIDALHQSASMNMGSLEADDLLEAIANPSAIAIYTAAPEVLAIAKSEFTLVLKDNLHLKKELQPFARYIKLVMANAPKDKIEPPQSAGTFASAASSDESDRGVGFSRFAP